MTPGNAAPHARSCRACGCTDADCTGCVERSEQPCYWVGPDLCSACDDWAGHTVASRANANRREQPFNHHAIHDARNHLENF